MTITVMMMMMMMIMIDDDDDDDDGGAGAGAAGDYNSDARGADDGENSSIILLSLTEHTNTYICKPDHQGRLLGNATCEQKSLK